jgi:UDP-2,4-diacetamido-2,4,6-trideoxy-beta-L-altropyranose hydrolase
MKVLIRTDASPQIGSGHLVRCLTLADALAARGAHVELACKALPPALAMEAQTHSAQLRYLPDSLDDAADAAALIAAVGNATFDWLVIDHYRLGLTFEHQAGQVARRRMVIDDLARPHDADILLDQNLLPNAAARYAGKVPAHCQMLLGPQYALLRQPFMAARRTLPPSRGPLRRVLVFYGGVDAGNETAKALAALADEQFADLAVDIVLGGANPHIAALQAAHGVRAQWQFHVQTQDMAGLMARADLFLGAGGTVQLERFCLGLPGIVTAVADNQVEAAQWAQKCGLADYLGSAKDVDPAKVSVALRRWKYTSHEAWNLICKKISSLEVGGSDAVAQLLLGA